MSSNENQNRLRSDSDVALRKIFIGGLSYSTDDEKLRNYFSVYGNVQDAVVMKDPVSRRSRGFGFITYENIDSVDNALDNEPHTIDSRKVEAKRAVPRSEVKDTGSSSSSSSSSKGGPLTNSPTTNAATPNIPPSVSTPSNSSNSSNFIPNHSLPPSAIPQPDSARSSNEEVNGYCKIFVGGLHYDTRDADFRGYFEKYGKVQSAEVMFNRETHKSRGFGFIIFESEDSVDAVCEEKEHIIDAKVVEVKRAIPRSKIPSSSTLGSSTTSSNSSAKNSLSTSNSSPVRNTPASQSLQQRVRSISYSSPGPKASAEANKKNILPSTQSHPNLIGNVSNSAPKTTGSSSWAAAVKRGTEQTTQQLGQTNSNFNPNQSNNVPSSYSEYTDQLDRPLRSQSEGIISLQNQAGGVLGMNIRSTGGSYQPANAYNTADQIYFQKQIIQQGQPAAPQPNSNLPTHTYSTHLGGGGGGGHVPGYLGGQHPQPFESYPQQSFMQFQSQPTQPQVSNSHNPSHPSHPSHQPGWGPVSSGNDLSYLPKDFSMNTWNDTSAMNSVSRQTQVSSTFEFETQRPNISAPVFQPASHRGTIDPNPKLPPFYPSHSQQVPPPPGNLWMPGHSNIPLNETNQMYSPQKHHPQYVPNSYEPNYYQNTNAAQRSSIDHPSQLNSETDDLIMLQNLQNMRFEFDSPSPDLDANGPNSAQIDFGIWKTGPGKK